MKTNEKLDENDEQKLNQVIDELLKLEVDWITDFKNPRVYSEKMSYQDRRNRDYAKAIRTRIVEELSNNED